MFFSKIKRSFRRVKKDMDALKHNTTEWIIFLNAENQELKARVEYLEKKLAMQEIRRW